MGKPTSPFHLCGKTYKLISPLWENLQAHFISLGKPTSPFHLCGKTYKPISYLWENLQAHFTSVGKPTSSFHLFQNIFDEICLFGGRLSFNVCSQSMPIICWISCEPTCWQRSFSQINDWFTVHLHVPSMIPFLVLFKNGYNAVPGCCLH